MVLAASLSLCSLRTLERELPARHREPQVHPEYYLIFELVSACVLWRRRAPANVPVEPCAGIGHLAYGNDACCRVNPDTPLLMKVRLANMPRILYTTFKRGITKT